MYNEAPNPQSLVSRPQSVGYTPQELQGIQQAYEAMLADISPFVNAPEHLALIDKAYR